MNPPFNKPVGQSRAEKLREYSKKWRAKNSEKIAETRKKNRAEDPEKYRNRSNEWKKQNPLAVRAHSSTHRARKVIGGKHTKEEIEKIHLLQRGKCAICGKSLEQGFHVDHILPLALGGSNDKHNLQILCPYCNKSKGAKHPLTHANGIGRLL